MNLAVISASSHFRTGLWNHTPGKQQKEAVLFWAVSLHVQTAEVLASLHKCVGLPELSVCAYMFSTLFACNSSFYITPFITPNKELSRQFYYVYDIGCKRCWNLCIMQKLNKAEKKKKWRRRKIMVNKIFKWIHFYLIAIYMHQYLYRYCAISVDKSVWNESESLLPLKFGTLHRQELLHVVNST